MSRDSEFPDRPDLDPAALRRCAHEAVDWMVDYLEGLGSDTILQTRSPQEVFKAFAEPLPEEGMLAEEVLNLFKEKVVRFATHLQGSGNFAYVPNSTGFIGVVADALASTLNQNVSLIRGGPSAAAIEHRVVCWLKELIEYPEEGGGVLASGGSAANLMGLALARDRAGVGGDQVFYMSREIHSSVQRGLRFLGLGADAMRLVETGADHRIRVDLLAEAMAHDERRGRKPVAVVASAGTIGSGAVDPLEEIAACCREAGVWLHVDGAYGALASAAPSGAWMRPGLARADSVSLDPHKWLFVPVDTSCLLVRDPQRMRRFFTLVPEYLKVRSAETEEGVPHPMEHTFELTRRFRALRIWMTLKTCGAAVLRRRIESHLMLAREFASWVDASPDYQLLAPVMTSIVCFRRIPAGVEKAAASDATPEIDRLNEEIMEALNRRRNIFVSHCRLRDTFSLRLCITNLRTRIGDLQHLWKALQEVAAAVEGVLKSGG